MDPRNSLVFEFARFIVEIQPRMHVTENVPGLKDMVTPEGLPVLDAYCRVLEDGNFASLNALKKTMEAQLGVALLRGRKPKVDERDDEDDDDDPKPTSKHPKKGKKATPAPQLDLFA
jgi:DNA (cytosine-5)-methyltransferase 1